MTTQPHYFRATDIYPLLKGSIRLRSLDHWVELMHIYSQGVVEGRGAACLMDRAAAEYEISAYCHGRPEALEAAMAYINGHEVISESDLAYSAEVAAAVDEALRGPFDVGSELSDIIPFDEAMADLDALLDGWVPEEAPDAAMSVEGVVATAQGVGVGSGLFNDSLVDLIAEYDVARFDVGDLDWLVSALAAQGDSSVVVMVHRLMGSSVPVYVGEAVAGRDGRLQVASTLLADVQKVWASLQRYEKAVAAYKKEEKGD